MSEYLTYYRRTRHTGYIPGVTPPVPVPTTSLELWLKSYMQTYQDTGYATPAVADGDVVGGWKDQFKTNHFLQATTLNKPVLKTNIQNGLPVVRCDGTNSFMALGSPLITATNNWAIFIVVIPRDVTTQRQIIFSIGTANGYSPAVTTNGDTKCACLYGGVAWNNTTTILSINTAIVLTMIRDSGTLTIYRNGTALTPTFAGAPSTPTTNTYLGWDNSNVKGKVDLGEILVYSAVPSRTTVESYLRSIWGI